MSVYKEKGSGDYTIRVPLVHEDYEILSGITVVYDTDKNFKYLLETIVYEDNGMGHFKLWQDNELKKEHSLSIVELEEEVDENGLAHQGLGCLNQCLSDQGLPLWALGLIGVVCAAACAGTGGIACAPCIQGLGLGFAAIFDYCLNVKYR